MTFVSIIGVAIGVAALIIVLSVMGGFEFDLRQKMLNGQPHLEVLAKENSVLGFSLLEYGTDQLRSELDNEEVKVAPFVKSDVVLKQKRHLSSATLVGVRPEDMENGNNQWAFEGTMIEGGLADLASEKRPAGSYPGIILGDTLAVNLSR
jgi:lipoprotein-releasing system permease protein